MGFALAFTHSLSQNIGMSGINQFIKRFTDIALVLVIFPLFIIIYGLVAVCLMFFQGRPVLFCQQRAGKLGRPFTLYKFRTMRTDCDPFGPSPQGGGDARLTSLGRILRKASLDELPQIWNILKGDMSLVGPRPLYVAQMAEWNDRQKRRLEVKPGLTGLAQVSGRGSLTIEEKLELDVQYVERQSLWLDLKILLLTVVQVFWPRHIYEKRYSREHQTRPSDNTGV